MGVPGFPCSVTATKRIKLLPVHVCVLPVDVASKAIAIFFYKFIPHVIASVSFVAITADEDRFASTNIFPVETASNSAAETTVTEPPDVFVNVFVTV